jgi:hypothetical protein
MRLSAGAVGRAVARARARLGAPSCRGGCVVPEPPHRGWRGPVLAPARKLRMRRAGDRSILSRCSPRPLSGPCVLDAATRSASMSRSGALLPTPRRNRRHGCTCHRSEQRSRRSGIPHAPRPTESTAANGVLRRARTAVIDADRTRIRGTYVDRIGDPGDSSAVTPTGSDGAVASRAMTAAAAALAESGKEPVTAAFHASGNRGGHAVKQRARSSFRVRKRAPPSQGVGCPLRTRCGSDDALRIDCCLSVPVRGVNLGCDGR